MVKWYYTYTWRHRTEMAVTVQNATAYEIPLQRLSRCIRHAVWALDYSATDFGLCRIGSVRQPWHHRPARIAHLYAPNTAYWEDQRHVAQPQREAFTTFWGGEYAGLEHLLHPQLRYARFEDPLGILGALFEELARHGQHTGESGYWYAQALLYQLIDYLNSAESLETGAWRIANRANRQVAELTPVMRIQQYLRDHRCERLTLSDIARDTHLSLSTLSHRYRIETGETPLMTHMRYRIARVKEMLILGFSLEIIAQQLGFSDAFHLSKTFKKYEGIPPRTFLAQQQGANVDMSR